MKNDPGLFTDSTGEGMAGATDVSLETQKERSRTVYNGEKACKSCGAPIDPLQSLLKDTCISCQRRKKYSLVKGRMA